MEIVESSAPFPDPLPQAMMSEGETSNLSQSNIGLKFIVNVFGVKLVELK